MAVRTAVVEHCEGVHDLAFHVASDECRSIDRASFREDQARDELMRPDAKIFNLVLGG